MSTPHSNFNSASQLQAFARFYRRALSFIQLPLCCVVACVGPDSSWEGQLSQGAPQPSSTGIGTWTPSDAGVTCSESLSIHEVHPNPVGADGDGRGEYVELTGPPGAALDGWSLRFINGADNNVYAQLDLQGAIPASGLLRLHGGTESSGHPSLPSALQQGPDSVQLARCGGEVVQELAYPAPGPVPDDLPEGMSMCWCGEFATVCPPTPGVLSLDACASVDDCEVGCEVDAVGPMTDAGRSTDEDAGDAPEWRDVGDDSASLLDVARARCSGASQQGIRIQEVLFDPAGADSLAAEFVEISVPPGETTQGLRLVHWDAGAGAEVWSHELTAMPTPNLVLGGVAGAAAALPAMLQNGPDAVWLEDCAGGVLDVVVYGTGEHRLPDWLELERTPAFEGRASHSLSACDGGRDSRGWFQGGAALPTPGEPNAGWVDVQACGPPCEASEPGAALIQEVLFNPDGADTGHEFVEIVAREGQLPDGLELHFVNGATGEAWVSPLALQVSSEATAVWVVGGAQVSGVDQLLHTTLQNGPDGIQLRGCDGRLLDTAGWGEAASGAQWVEAHEVVGVREGCSMTRSADARDTQNNREDFRSDCSPSPGVP